jgi:hypothetical protein
MSKRWATPDVIASFSGTTNWCCNTARAVPSPPDASLRVCAEAGREDLPDYSNKCSAQGLTMNIARCFALSCSPQAGCAQESLLALAQRHDGRRPGCFAFRRNALAWP